MITGFLHAASWGDMRRSIAESVSVPQITAVMAASAIGPNVVDAFSRSWTNEPHARDDINTGVIYDVLFDNLERMTRDWVAITWRHRRNGWDPGRTGDLLEPCTEYHAAALVWAAHVDSNHTAVRVGMRFPDKKAAAHFAARINAEGHYE